MYMYMYMCMHAIGNRYSLHVQGRHWQAQQNNIPAGLIASKLINIKSEGTYPNVANGTPLLLLVGLYPGGVVRGGVAGGVVSSCFLLLLDLLAVTT